MQVYKPPHHHIDSTVGRGPPSTLDPRIFRDSETVPKPPKFYVLPCGAAEKLHVPCLFLEVGTVLGHQDRWNFLRAGALPKITDCMGTGRFRQAQMIKVGTEGC